MGASSSQATVGSTTVDVLHAFRDDGPIAVTVAPAVARLPVPPIAAVPLGVVALIAGLAVDGRATGTASILGVGAFVVLLAAGAARPPRRRLQWIVSPALRAGEYGLVALLGWRAGGGALPAAYLLQCAIAFHHYDTVYRLRQQVPGAPDALRLAGLGWDGRMVLLLVAALAGVFAPVAVALATWCAVLFVGDSVTQWLRTAGGSPDAGGAPEDDDD